MLTAFNFTIGNKPDFMVLPETWLDQNNNGVVVVNPLLLISALGVKSGEVRKVEQRSCLTMLTNVQCTAGPKNIVSLWIWKTPHETGRTTCKGHTLDLIMSKALRFSQCVVTDVSLTDHFCVFSEMSRPTLIWTDGILRSFYPLPMISQILLMALHPQRSAQSLLKKKACG